MFSLILLGPPGSGKGTQAQLLSQHHDFYRVSTGDMLREEIRNRTKLGIEVEEILAQGRFVSNDIILEMIKGLIHKVKNRPFLFDGYPRNLAQAQTFDQLKGLGLISVVYIDVPENALMARITGRLICAECGEVYHSVEFPPKVKNICDSCGSKLTIRADDLPDRVNYRLKLYETETLPVVEHYEKKRLLVRIKGEKPPLDIKKSVLKHCSRYIARS